MSVLNQMLRDLQARGEPVPGQGSQTAHKNVGTSDPYVAGAPVIPSLLPINNLSRWDTTRVVLWSLTALIAAGFLGGLQWQKQQVLQAAAKVKPPLGYAEFKGAINNNNDAPLAAVPIAVTPAATFASPAVEVETIATSVIAEAAPVLLQPETVMTENAAPENVKPEAFVSKSAAAQAPTSSVSIPSAPAPRAQATIEVPKVAKALSQASAPETAAQETSARNTAVREAPTRALNSQANTQLALAAPSSRELPLPARDSAPENAVRLSSTSANNPEITVARAADLIARGRNIDAALLLRQTLTMQPRHVDARRALAALQAEAGQQDAALVTLLEGAQVDPARFAPMAAALQVELGNAQGALATLARIPAEAQTAQHHALAAGIAQRIGAHEQAVSAFRRALAANAQEPAWWIGLAVSLEALGQRSDAQAAYERATAIPTTSTELREFAVQKLSQLALNPAH